LGIILSAALAAIPTVPPSHYPSPGVQVSTSVTSLGDPNATTTAFNYTYSQANLYTNSSAHFAPNVTGTSFLWQGTVTQTKTNTTIPGSGFLFNVTQPNLAQGKEVGNYNVTVPQFGCKNCATTKINFDFAGTLTKGTNASYTTSFKYNGTKIRALSQNFTKPGQFQGNPVGCLQDFCLDVTKYIGYDLTLTFSFGWNSSETSMGVRVGEIVVASIGDYLQSSSNFMQLTSGQVVHTAKLSSINLNNTQKTILQPSGTPSILPWHIGIVSIYYPGGYSIKQILLNSTVMLQIPPISPEVPFETDHCFNGIPPCSQSLISLNVTDFAPLTGAIHNSTITIISTTPNSMFQLTPTAAGVPTNLFSPGDQIGLKIVNKPSIVNATTALKTGTLNITFVDSTGAVHSLGGQANLNTASGGIFNFTLPSDCAFCGRWNVTAVFASQYDLGAMFSLFRVDQMQVNSFSSSGSNNGLAVQGTLTYANSSAAKAASGYVFAVDAGIPTNVPITTTNSSSTGLYFSNVTLVNGIFTQGQTMIMLFSVVNPTSPPQDFRANVTLQHEWPGSQTHGVNATFQLGLGDGLYGNPFTLGPQVYQAAFTLTASGIQLSLISVTNQHSKTLFMSLGTSPVSPARQHAGLFKIIIDSKAATSASVRNSIESPPYAYVFGLPLTPSRYLAYSAPFTTDTTGNFSPPAIKSDSILAAQKLVVFALARDAAGIILVNNAQNPGFSDSTILQSTTDKLDPVTQGQTVTTTLHLKSTSQTITEVITIDLNLQGSGRVAEQTGITIAPGASQDVAVSFKAPSTTGQYPLSFSSPQYAGPLASQTLQVTIIQSNLQILIPAAIGVVAAIIVLGFYLIKRQPATTEAAERTKPAATKPKTSGSGNRPSKSLT